MRVICIDDKERPGEYPDADFTIKEGETYNVCRAVTSENGIFCYSLLEDPYRAMYCYAADRFIPVSDIDEKEFERNYNFQTV